MRLRIIGSGIILLVAVCLFSSCANSAKQPDAPQTSASPEPTPATAAAPVFSPLLAQASPSPASNPSPEPPKPAEMKTAVARVFEKSAAPDPSREPDFVTGDFNGDGSEDLAILIKPGDDSLAEINNEFANWVLEDPRYVALQDAKTVRPAAPKPARAEKGETLLAIIHGVGAQGWRNPGAKQTFLLKNAAGKMTFESFRSLRGSQNKQKLPPLRGDAIGETSGHAVGLVYWNGAKYSWYSISK